MLTFPIRGSPGQGQSSMRIQVKLLRLDKVLEILLLSEILCWGMLHSTAFPPPHLMWLLNIFPNSLSRDLWIPPKPHNRINVFKMMAYSSKWETFVCLRQAVTNSDTHYSPWLSKKSTLMQCLHFLPFWAAQGALQTQHCREHCKFSPENIWGTSNSGFFKARNWEVGKLVWEGDSLFNIHSLGIVSMFLPQACATDFKIIIVKKSYQV